MTVLTYVSDFLSFYARAAALSQKIEDGVLSQDEQAAAVRGLFASGPVGKPVVNARLVPTAA